MLQMHDVRHAIQQAVDGCQAKGGRNISITLNVRYDETDFKIITAESLGLMQLPPEFEHIKDIFTKDDLVSECQDKSPTKVLQTELSVTTLFQTGDCFTAITLCL